MPEVQASPALLPWPVIRDFSASFFNRRQVFLDAAKSLGSPLYLIEREVLAQRARQFRQAFEAHLPRTSFYYAMKSNNLPPLSGEMLGQGFGLDVSSGLELDTALKLGARDIIFSGPGKTEAELELAAGHPDRVTLLVDSMGECRRLAALLERKQIVMEVGIRLNNNPQGLWRKFGILPTDLPGLYDEFRDHPFLKIRGLQFHSSWNLNPDRQIEFLEKVGDLLSAMPKDFLQDLGFVDIGGGYWPPQGEWLLSGEPGQVLLETGTPIEVFGRQLSGAIKENILRHADCRICFEPGRWICNDVLHILIQVVDKKEPDLVIADAGTNALGWERFETDYFPVLNLTRPGLEERQCHILGSLCTPHDVWGYSFLGEDIQEGDILMIPTQGAYTYSLRQNFIKPLPSVGVIDRDHPPYLLDLNGPDLSKT